MVNQNLPRIDRIQVELVEKRTHHIKQFTLFSLKTPIKRQNLSGQTKLELVMCCMYKMYLK